MKVVVLDSLPLAELCRKKVKSNVGGLLLFLKDREISLRVAEITEVEKYFPASDRKRIKHCLL